MVENLGILSYNMWWLVNLIFFHHHWVFLELVEVLNFLSWRIY